MDSTLTREACSTPGIADSESSILPMLEPATPMAVEARGRWSLSGLWSLLLVFVLLAAGGWYALHDPGYQESVRKTFAEASGTMYRTLVSEIVLNPWF